MFLLADELCRTPCPVKAPVHNSCEPSLFITHSQFKNQSKTLQGVLPHFKLMNEQLSQLRVALVAAKELGGAAAVLPHLWLGKQNDIWPGDGYFRESRFQMPFTAPADYTMDLEWCVGTRETGI